MKATLLVLLLAGCTVWGETEEHFTKRFAVQALGKLELDVDFGSIDVSTNGTQEVVVEVLRKVKRRDKAEEEEYLRERPVTFAQDGNAITVQARAKSKESWHGSTRTEGHYTITVPAQFSARLKTAGGGIEVTGLSGDVKAPT